MRSMCLSNNEFIQENSVRSMRNSIFGDKDRENAIYGRRNSTGTWSSTYRSI